MIHKIGSQLMKMTAHCVFGEWSERYENESKRTKHFLLGSFLMGVFLISAVFLIGKTVSSHNEHTDLLVANVKLHADLLTHLWFAKTAEDFVHAANNSINYVREMMQHNKTMLVLETCEHVLWTIQTIRDNVQQSELAQMTYKWLVQIFSAYQQRAEDGTLDKGDKETMNFILVNNVPTKVYETMPEKLKALTFNHHEETVQAFGQVMDHVNASENIARMLHNNSLRMIDLCGLDKPFHAVSQTLSAATGMSEPIIVCLTALIFGLPGYVLMIILPIFPLEYYTMQHVMIPLDGELVRTTNPLSLWQYILLLWFGKGITHISHVLLFAVVYLYADKCCPSFCLCLHFLKYQRNKLCTNNKKETYYYTLCNSLIQVMENRCGPLIVVKLYTLTNIFGYLILSFLDSFGVQLYETIQFLEIKHQDAQQYVKLRLAMLYQLRYRLLVLSILIALGYTFYLGLSRWLNTVDSSRKHELTQKRSTKKVKQPEEVPVIKEEVPKKKLLSSEMQIKALKFLLGNSSWYYPTVVVLSAMASFLPVEISAFVEPIGDSTIINSGLYYCVLWLMEMLTPLERFVPAGLAQNILEAWV